MRVRKNPHRQQVRLKKKLRDPVVFPLLLLGLQLEDVLWLEHLPLELRELWDLARVQLRKVSHPQALDLPSSVCSWRHRCVVNQICLFRCGTRDTNNLEKHPWETCIVPVCGYVMDASWLDDVGIQGIRPALAVAGPAQRVQEVQGVAQLLVPQPPPMQRGTWHDADPAP